MRLLPILVAALVAGATLPSVAQTARPQPASPTRIGVFGSWTAAWYRDGQTKVCYAFTRATRSQPARENVIMTVTHRGTSRDEVAVVPRYNYPRGAPDVVVTIGGTELPFYVGPASAQARDRRAAINALRTGREAVARGSHPSRMPAIDHFNLAGFAAAYDAINRECPPGGAPAPRR